MKKILVTGGSGYYGSFVCKQLVNSGEKVINFDLNDFDEPIKNVKVLQGDIRDFEALLSATKGVDIVHHNVAQVPIAKDKHLFESVNIDGTRNLLEACFRNKVKKVIYTSSSAVFGVPEKNPVDDSTLPNPMDPYGKTKFEGELICNEYIKKGLDVTIIRPRTIMGHGRLGIFQILFEWIKDNANIPVLGRGDNLYQFVHAEDLADASIKASYKKGPQIYNIGAEEFDTMRGTLEKLIKHVGSNSKVKSFPLRLTVLGMKLTSKLGLSPLGPYHSLMYGRSMYFDISKAKKELKWKPKWSNIEMFIDAYKWYSNNLEKIFNETKKRSHHKSPMKQGVLKIIKRII